MMQVMINNACKYTNANSYSNESKCYKYIAIAISDEY